MKKVVFTIIIVISFCLIFSIQNWRVHTNTTHMRDMTVYRGKLVIATWGGLEMLDLKTREYTGAITMGDGLKGHDISALALVDESELLIGVRDRSIDRMVNGRFAISLSTDLGMSSLATNTIYTHNDWIFVGNDNGLDLFVTDENFSLSIFKENYKVGFTSVNSIATDKNNYLYLGTNTGITRIHTDSLNVMSQWKSYSLSSSERVFHIDIKEDKLAVATNKKVFILDINSFDWKNNLSITDNLVDVIELGCFSTVKQIENKVYAIFGEWMDNGNIFLPDTIYNYSILIKEAGKPIQYIKYGINETLKKPATNILFADHTFFVSTWGAGLYSFTDAPNSWRNYPQNTIHSNAITSIGVDLEHTVWFSNGIDLPSPPVMSSTGVSGYNTLTDRWVNYSMEDSGLGSNQITSIGIDAMNRKWFGGWYVDGNPRRVSILDDTVSDSLDWRYLRESDFSTRSITRYKGGMIITASNRVYSVNQDLTSFRLSGMPGDITGSTLHGDSLFIGNREENLNIYRVNQFPNSLNPVNFSLPTGRMFKICSYKSDEFNQVWFATQNGLMYLDKRNGVDNWYKFTTLSKREIFRGGWLHSQYYFGDEERVFGAEEAVPNSMVIDHFGRVWVGSTLNGITMFDIYTDRFYNFKTTNSPLISDMIVYLDYQPKSGLLFIATAEGLMSVDVGKGEKVTKRLDRTEVYPNPFRPSVHGKVTIQSKDFDTMPMGKNECKIFDISGQLIITLNENRYLEFEWDGRNSAGKNCGSGVYFYSIKTSVGESSSGRIVLIR